jgi:two-component sensor histidine kinase
MKKLLFYSIACLPTLDALAQKPRETNAQKEHFFTQFVYTDSTAILFENHFFRNANNVTYQPYDIKAPFKDLNFDIYGNRLKLSAYYYPELIKNGGWASTGSYRDTLKEDAFLFDLGTLEYKIIKNNATETGWRKATENHYTDTLVSILYGKSSKVYFRQGYLFYDDSLSDGDSLSLSLRKENGKPFLNIHFKKRSPLESPPRSMGYTDNHDKDLPLEKFIQRALEQYQLRTTNFYDDWPGENDRGNLKLFPDTKTAYFFHPRDEAPNDSSFEYRVLVNGDRSAKWKKSDNIVFVSGLKAGTQYQLEVRHTKRPQYVFTKKFYVPGYWYQTILFKTGVAFLFLLLGMIFFFILKNKKQKRTLLEHHNKMKTLHAQLNPHFIFNALGSIQGLLNDDQLEKANKYLSGFGNLLRSTLDSSEKAMITLQEELQNLSIYIELEQLRRPFTYIKTIDEDINATNVEMLPLFFQPIIENAIKHGYSDHSHALDISFSLKRKGNDLEAGIQDNGKGFDTNTVHKGQGLRLVKERIDLFNRISKNKKLVIEISSNKNGTLVWIKFINWIDHD